MSQLSLRETQPDGPKSPKRRGRPSSAPASGVEGDNVDPREVAYYESLAATWWDRSGPFWPLHRLNALRSNYLRHVLARLFERNPKSEQPLTGLRMLDVGCGGGILSESMARLGAEVLGVDVVEKNIEIARLHARESDLNVRYETTSTSALVKRGEQFDVLLNMEVVEHVPNVPAFMAECAALVRPGGVMSVSTINRTAKSWLFAIVGAEYVMRWLPRGTHRWAQFVKPAEIESLLKQHDFEVAASAGVRVNPLTRRFSLSANMAVNYMLVARKAEPSAARTEKGS